MSQPNSGPGFISRVSPVQVRPPLIDLPDWFPAPLSTSLDVRFGESNAEYHSDARPSKSSIADFDVGGPLLFELKHVLRAVPPEQSPAMSFGTILHEWVELGNDAFWDRVVPVPPEYATLAGEIGKKGDEWLKTLPPDAIPLTDTLAAKLRLQTSQLLRNSRAREILEEKVGGEFSVRFEFAGHPIRCRPDIATKTLWADVKTTREVQPKAEWFKSVRQYRYAMQSAIYEEGARQCGWPDFKLVYIVTSTVPPHYCHCMTIPDPWVAQARVRVLQILEEIAERKSIGHWYPDDYGQVIEVPFPGSQRS